MQDLNAYDLPLIHDGILVIVGGGAGFQVGGVCHGREVTGNAWIGLYS